MAIIRLQTEAEKRKGIFYQFDTDIPPIGEGGMGKVCEGLCVNEQNGFTRPVAIKFMFDDLPPSAYERARREAEIQLRNDNLVDVVGKGLSALKGLVSSTAKAATAADAKVSIVKILALTLPKSDPLYYSGRKGEIVFASQDKTYKITVIQQ